MTNNRPMPEWPFWTGDSTFDDFELNQSLSVILDDDELRQKLISGFADNNAKKVQPFPSAHHPDDVRSHPYSHIQPGHHKHHAWIVAGYDELRHVLSKPEDFSNVPYAELGDRSFVLAMDPYNTSDNPQGGQLYSRQRDYMNALMEKPEKEHLSKLAIEAVRHAVVAGLTRNEFDLAKLAEQAAVRFCGLWFGFASTDHELIENTAAASYRALVHLILGKHFGNEPTVIPEARQAMAQLTERASELITEYRKVQWEPREVRGNLKHRQERAKLPEGTTPLTEWGLDTIGQPLLQRMALGHHDFTVAELASMVTGLIAGTIGNVQASACLVVQQIFTDQARHLNELKSENGKDSLLVAKAKTDANKCAEQVHSGALHKLVGQCLMRNPPVAFLPRRAVRDVTLGNQLVKKGDDVILWLSAAAHIKQLKYEDGKYGLPFGATDAAISYANSSNSSVPPHSCIGKAPAHALITAITGTVLRLPSVAEVIDPHDGKPKGLTRRWGFSCESYPLTHKRPMRLAQQPLNVIMRVKAPTDYHGRALQQIIHVGAPRVEKVLNESGHVHFAWFQLIDQGRYLVLHTVYDGDFDAYIQDFALKVDDLFDLLFEHIEGAPKLPVAENPGSFVDVIRAYNAPAVNGYFYSATPTVEVGIKSTMPQRHS